MSSAEALRAARAAGIQIEIDGDDLVLEAAARPPDELLAKLKQHKAEIVALLQPGTERTATEAVRLSAAETLLGDALRASVEIRPIGGKIAITGTVSRELQGRLDEYWPEIEALFAANPCEPHPAPAAAWPEPEIVKDPNFAFGADHVPQRYRRAWQELLSGPPPGVSEAAWLQAIYDARDLFSEWGTEIERIRWDDDSVFEWPGGLIWFLEGEYVTFPGGMTAHTSGKRIWRRKLQR